jgi:hypothetical protein
MNTYTLKSGKVISEGQTLTADDLTVSELKELYSIHSCYRARTGHGVLNPTIFDFPIIVVTLPAPEPKTPLTVDAIMEGLERGMRYKLSKEGCIDKMLQGRPCLNNEMKAAHCLANGWTVTEVS